MTNTQESAMKAHPGTLLPDGELATLIREVQAAPDVREWDEDLCRKIAEALSHICALTEQRDGLLEALKGLYADQVDYLTINKLGGMDNHWMVLARAAIARSGAK